MAYVKKNIFESHAKITVCVIVILILLGLYGITSVKIINNAYTEFESKSLKTIFFQYYFGKIIDNNIGRFIKLREHAPSKTLYERPTRRYIKNISPNSLERKYYPMVTDQEGFIMGPSTHRSPKLKIVFLGGSTTECLYMEPQERFPFLVGDRLEKKLNQKVNSYNGGVSANDSLHSINILLNKVIPMKPDWVILMHNVNDLNVLRSQGTYWTKQGVKSPIQTAKNVFTRYEFGPKNRGYVEKEIRQAFARNLETFIAICRIQAINPVLMTQVSRVAKDPLFYEFNQIIRTVAHQHNILLIDLARHIPPTIENLYDDYHYTAKGANQVANLISEELAKTIRQGKFK